MRFLSVSLLLTLFISCPAGAWHDYGHRATASVAFEAMADEQQHAVIAVLKTHPRYTEDFADLMPASVSAGSDSERGRWLLEQAATWPDLIQILDAEVKREYNRSRWHYINRVIYLSEDDEAALGGILDHNMSTKFETPLRQNLNSIQALRGNLRVWRDVNVSDAEKAIALCWILHLTGDMHQPLHNVALFSRPYFPTGDRGGNDIEVLWGDDTRNLHAVWDGLPGDMDDLTPSARTLRTIQSESVDNESIDEWLHHHARLAEMFVYTDEVKAQLRERLARRDTPQISLSHEYLVSARSVVRRQINLAGHRIARLLD